jgi:hypothetical protein
VLAVRKVWTVLVGAWSAAILARAILDWALGLDGAGVFAAILAGSALGALASVGAARRLEPMDPEERRDSILGWGALIGGVGSVACLFLPLPWGAVAAGAVLVLTVALLQRLPKLPRATRESARPSASP